MSVRVGVAGMGIFGGYHANKLQEAKGATLEAVFDHNRARVRAQAAERGVAAYGDYQDFLAAVEAVVVATPASFHGTLAEAALKAGKPVLVEKPIAVDDAQAAHMIELAHKGGLVLQVGHQERYVAEAMGLLAKNVRPLRVISRRLSGFSGRAMDVSVVLDLMIHDLDLVLQYTPGDVQGLKVTAGHHHGEKADYVKAEITFSSGLEAQLEAGRIAQTPRRDLQLDFDTGPLMINFLDRTITNEAGLPLPLAHGFDSKTLPLALRDPLLHGTQAFIEAITRGEAPDVTGADGLAALKLALLIEARL